MFNVKEVKLMRRRLSRNIRREALQKLATLSAKTSTNFEHSDLERLTLSNTHHKISNEQTNGYAVGITPSLQRQPMVNMI